MVPLSEVEKNDFNLNIPRYIDAQQAEDLQDIDAHLNGGIPEADIDALERYWSVCPNLRKALFKPNRPGYLDLAVAKDAIKPTIYSHPEFASFISGMNDHFAVWQKKATATLKDLTPGFHPKELAAKLSEDLLAYYANKPLIDPYDVYQHFMDYWDTTMQDDCYFVAADGWKAETYRVVEKDKKGKEKDKGWACDLVPKPLIVARYFKDKQDAIDSLAADLEAVTAQMAELEEEHGGDEGAFSEFEKVNKAEVAKRLKEIKGDAELKDEADVLSRWLKLCEQESDLKRKLKDTEGELDALAYKKYPTLSEAEVKALVVEDKWLGTIVDAVQGEVDRTCEALTQRVRSLGIRYAEPMPLLVKNSNAFETRVKRQALLDEWYRHRLREAAEPLMARWEKLIGVKANKLYVQRMKTRWGSCNHRSKAVRLNSELAKKPPDCLEYIVVHELIHLIEPTHNRRFSQLLERYMPDWQHRRDVLNRLPVRYENWVY